MKNLDIIPAYGRDYSFNSDAIADWKARKDFKIPQGPYLSIDDTPALKRDGYTQVTIVLHKHDIMIIVEL